MKKKTLLAKNKPSPCKSNCRLPLVVDYSSIADSFHNNKGGRLTVYLRYSSRLLRSFFFGLKRSYGFSFVSSIIPYLDAITLLTTILQKLEQKENSA